MMCKRLTHRVIHYVIQTWLLKKTHIYIYVLLRYNHDALIHFQLSTDLCPKSGDPMGFRIPISDDRTPLVWFKAAAPKVAVGKKAEVAVGMF